MIANILGIIGGISGICFIYSLKEENKYRKIKELFKANICESWSYIFGIVAISCLFTAVIF